MEGSKAGKSKDYPLVEAAKIKNAYFTPLYDKYFKPIFIYIIKKVKDNELAGDLTSQVFLKAMLNINKYEDRGHLFSSWLYTIAYNEINLHYRKLKKYQEVEIKEKDAINLLGDIEEEKDVFHQEILIEAMNSLKEKDLEIIDYRYFEKLSFIEIGEILGITDGNAKIRLYRSVKKLGKIYKRIESEKI